MDLEERTPLWSLQKLLGLRLPHKIIDGICGPTYPLQQDYQSVWDSTARMHVLYCRVFQSCSWKTEVELHQLNKLDSFHQEAIMKCLKSMKDKIKQALSGEIVGISSTQLQDFDWQLKLALSIDKIATLRMPLSNLHLHVKENGEVKSYSVGRSKEELQNLNFLAATNKVILHLK
uniref:COMM domain-containing protein n=1 Tax=Myotis lucifugus TaxID=59463 RepID=G1Q464_MYOLU